MCGIVGYLGFKPACQVVLSGLKSLEYRGYDSAGLSIQNGSKIQTVKKKGSVSVLEKALNEAQKNNATLYEGNFGIGHTRWATHGVPNDTNSHPHTSQNNLITLVHNGVIENYESLKKRLVEKGYLFQSDTDTEVLANLVDFYISHHDLGFLEAVQKALQNVVGAYALLALSPRFPEQMVLARLSSPLVVGIGKGEFYIASDATPFLQYTRRVIYLEDHNIALLEPEKPIIIRSIADNSELPYKVEELDWDLGAAEKDGYESFMLKEIFAQPQAISDAMRGRVSSDFHINMKSIQDHRSIFEDARRIIIVACGTSWHAGLIGEYMIEEFARIPVETEYASEFRYRDPILFPNDIVIAVSQSGETADTLAAVRLAKSKKAFVYGICNVVGSSLARESDTGCYTHAGPEIGVASTKAFTTQLTVFFILALEVASIKGSPALKIKNELIEQIIKLPNKVQRLLKTCEPEVIKVAKTFHQATNFLYLGRGYNFPLALEGALKLKEISYIHAEGYPAAEMKHGPIALIDENMPVMVVISRKNSEKINSNIQEILSRKGKVIVISTQSVDHVPEGVVAHIQIPNTIEPLVPILASIPMQLLSYHVASLRGLNVDRPRNLAKSVTVE